MSRRDLFRFHLLSAARRERPQNLHRYPIVLLARYSSDALRRSVHEGKGRLMKTNRLFALGLLTAVASGACGGDDGKTQTGTKDGGNTVTLPDGQVVQIGSDGGFQNGFDGGNGNGNPDGGDNGNPDGGGNTTPGEGSKLITAAGGSVTSKDGRLTVTFSRYALT